TAESKASNTLFYRQLNAGGSDGCPGTTACTGFVVSLITRMVMVIGYGASGADVYGGCIGEDGGNCNGAFGFGGALVKVVAVVVMNFILADVYAALVVLLVVPVVLVEVLLAEIVVLVVWWKGRRLRLSHCLFRFGW
ncbi:unnamed protein product, partial [Hymenolepis diminuta]|uniref:Transmembrane protein n=1 Tax=Hymenolepis diminuta TaxID=6216 RepID=A0A0R3SKH7_HYMDI